MQRILVFAYSLFAYLMFGVAILWLLGFEENLLVPNGIDQGQPRGLGEAVVINALLLGLFALQHTVMARGRFKTWITRFIPKAAERATFVLLASLIVLLICWQWRPVPEVVWSVEGIPGSGLLALSFAGWGILVLGTIQIGHFEIFGLEQGYHYLRGHEPPAPEFKTPGMYKYVRHPMMTGILIGVWATPKMTLGHLIFAVGMTGYIAMGVWFEERELISLFADRYREYKASTPKLLPLGKRAKRTQQPAEAMVGPARRA